MYKNTQDQNLAKENKSTSSSSSAVNIHLSGFGSSSFLCLSYSMALAKDRALEGSQACPVLYGGGSSIQELSPPSLEPFGYRGHSFGSYSSGLLPFLSDPCSNSASCSSSTNYVFGVANSPPQEALSSVVTYKTSMATEHWASCSNASSVLNFEQGGLNHLDHEDERASWIDAMDQNYQLIGHLDIKQRRAADSCRLIHERDCFEVESGGYGLMQSPVKEKRQGPDRFGLIYPGGGAAAVDGLQESIGQAAVKRPPTDACDMPSPKKQCRNSRKNKDKSSPSKDPQSVATKNRRERISERLKILQDLVPNGTKVDLVTMLEKAISYVKFLQLQVKVLATDEFWPAQGGKAPDIRQVKEAIDAIFSSQIRGRNSSFNQY